MSDINARVKLIFERKNISQKQFSEEIGTTQQYISAVLKGERKVGSNLTERILKAFPDVGRYWLLTGEEDINTNKSTISEPNTEYTKAPVGKFDRKKSSNELVPFYNLDFAAGNKLVLVDNNQVKPDYYMDVPEFAGCTAFRAYSDSMERLIKSGSILFGTKLEEWNIHLEYGQIYGIICTDGRRYLKYIKKFKENPSEYFLFESENENYDEFEMPKEYIRSIWLIHGWLNKRT
jgi:transcriptional regulator with XRE-family HTH domain